MKWRVTGTFEGDRRSVVVRSPEWFDAVVKGAHMIKQILPDGVKHSDVIVNAYPYVPFEDEVD